jgi:hypothetical protein
MTEDDDLERRVRWLYGRIRATASERVTRFDRTPEILDLAAAAERCREVTAPLLDGETRDRYESDVTAWQSWREQRAMCSSAAIRVGSRIAETPPGSDARRAPQDDFVVARARLNALDADRERLRSAADVAEGVLKADEVERAANADTIERGQQAWTELIGRLRIQIETAVNAFEVLPEWFERALGMSPPADAEQWFRTGAEVLAYRATYGIDDEHALGSRPSDQAPAHRLRWYEQLVTWLEPYGADRRPDRATG